MTSIAEDILGPLQPEAGEDQAAAADKSHPEVEGLLELEIADQGQGRDDEPDRRETNAPDQAQNEIAGCAQQGQERIPVGAGSGLEKHGCQRQKTEQNRNQSKPRPIRLSLPGQ